MAVARLNSGSATAQLLLRGIFVQPTCYIRTINLFRCCNTVSLIIYQFLSNNFYIILVTDLDIGKDFLSSWKSISVAEDMDFDFGSVTKGNKKTFSFDKM